MERAFVERPFNRIDVQAAPRGPSDHGHLAESHTKDVEHVNLHLELALKHAELVDRPNARDRPRDPPGPRTPRDPGVRLDIPGKQLADRVPIRIERSLEIDFAASCEVPDDSVSLGGQARGPQSEFGDLEPIGPPGVIRLQPQDHVSLESHPGTRTDGRGQVVQLEL